METVETRISTLYRSPEGILYARVKKGILETLPMAQENGAALMALKGNDPPMPILIDFSKAAGQDQETRKYYAERSGDWCTKAAILIQSPIARVMGNIYLGLNKPTVPTQLFTTEEAALAWLKRG